jgi:hypothetical protein
MGVGGDSFGTYSDAFDRRGRSYGPLPYDRTHGFSIAYNYLLPGKFNNHFLQGAFGGWQLSGISQVQSGAPLRNFTFTGTMADGQNMDAKIVAGTTDTSARPVLVCDPRTGVKDGQYANPACFTTPLPGHNGSYQLPYMKTPAFQNHDLSVFKNFEFSESKKLQFRYSMFNFLNHPLYYFEGNDRALAMNFDNGKPDANTMKYFGTPTLKRGHRLMQFALKYYF